MLALAGSGTNLGLTLVFLRSIPTMDVPRGSMTPPCIELNWYSTLLAFCTSNSVPMENSFIAWLDPLISVTAPAVLI